MPEPDREAEWQPSDVAVSASGFAAVVGPWDPGDDSAVIVSSDGETWVAGKAPASVADAGLAAIAGFGSDFVALGGRADDTNIDRPVIWTTIEPDASS